MTTEAEESLRYRRAQSVTRAEEITEKEKKVRRLQLDRPCHKPRDSLFSWSSGFGDFTGLVNWGFLMLNIGGLRLCLENFLKYGFRVNPIEWIIVLTGSGEGQKSQYPSLVLLIFCVVPVVISLLIEKSIAVDMISGIIGVSLQVINMIFVILLPVIVLNFKGAEFSFVGITTVCMIYLMTFLKLWSYVQTNHWCRSGMKKKFAKNALRRQSLSAPNWNQLINATQDRKSNNDRCVVGLFSSLAFGALIFAIDDEKVDEVEAAGIVQYPDNLYLKDIFYFMLAPTLCYELNFPRTARIRKRFLFKRLLELTVGVNLLLAIIQQWMIPCVTNSLETFSSMDLIRITERLLKLAVPNHLLWIGFFYLVFHSFLNLAGELLQFADRAFYGDWWNSKNISVFWRTWNLPVHHWAVRHVYIPITEKGYSKGVAAIAVFIISALFHEYLVSVPLQMFRVWAFLAMMAQPALSVISSFAETHFGPRWGNLIVWSSLILGQPLAVMMYYHDYAVAHLQQ